MVHNITDSLSWWQSLVFHLFCGCIWERNMWINANVWSFWILTEILHLDEAGMDETMSLSESDSLKRCAVWLEIKQCECIMLIKLRTNCQISCCLILKKWRWNAEVTLQQWRWIMWMCLYLASDQGESVCMRVHVCARVHVWPSLVNSRPAFTVWLHPSSCTSSSHSQPLH